jgi:hypothetical protein
MSTPSLKDFLSENLYLKIFEKKFLSEGVKVWRPKFVRPIGLQILGQALNKPARKTLGRH